MEHDHCSAEARFKGLLPEQIEVLLKYDRDNSLKNLAESTCFNKTETIKLFSRQIKKPYDKITEEDIKEYILSISKRVKPNTLSMIKSYIKSFFKWYYKDENPEIVRWLKTGFAKSKHRLPDSILTPAEIKILIDTATKIQHKALVAVLFDSGARLGEIAGMNLNQIEFDKNGAYTIVDGKTGKRIVRFIHSMSYLSNWIEHHPHKNNKNENVPLWVSESSATNGNRLSKMGIYKIISAIADETNINKRISPHQFRHARLTDLAKKNINESTLKVIAGWTGNSSMPEIYVHLSGRDGANKLLEIEKQGYVKPDVVENPLTPIECPRCKTENGATVNFCGKCAMPLDETTLITKETNMISNPLEILSKMKEYTNNYESLVNGIWDILKLRKIMK